MLLVCAALLAAAGGFWLARQLDRPAPQLASGTWLPSGKPLDPFTLLDTRGQPFTLAQLRGAPALIFFGFTHCPDVCPTTLAKLAALSARRGVPPLRVLFVSIDPERDTPAALARYVHAFDPRFEGLTGEPAALRSLAARFGVVMNRVELPGGDYTMDHSAVLFLTDRAGRIVAVFTPPFEVAALAADLERAAPYLRSSS